MQVRFRYKPVSIACTFALATLALSAQAVSFVDPTAQLIGKANITLGNLVYVAPFARLTAPNLLQSIRVGNESNIQDNVEVNAGTGPVIIGNQVILAHGATVKGLSVIGTTGRCPVFRQAVCPSFVSFNAVIDGATIQKDAMVSALARVGPGVTIPSGRKVLSGANITSNAQVAAKTVPVVAADRLFMEGVITVNREFAVAYAEMAALEPAKVRGIGPNPVTAFDLHEVLPTIGGAATADPTFRNRIIGDVEIGNTLADLNQRMGGEISLRADEGHPFIIGSIASMASKTTFHALEETDIHVGTDAKIGFHSVIHGGGAHGEMNAGNDVTVGDWSVLFRSTVADGSRIGYKSLVQQANLPLNEVVPPCTIIIGTTTTPVEWCGITP